MSAEAEKREVDFRVANEYALTLEGIIERSFMVGHEAVADQIISSTEQLMDYLQRKHDVLKDNPYWRSHFYFASLWLP